jgi:hypothetical protein
MTISKQDIAASHIAELQRNSYPGRGIVIGLTPDATRLVQVYWIMGRSVNSRNRVFIRETNGYVRTEAKDPALLTDPSLIIYYPVKNVASAHIVTNGDQTDTIFDAISGGGTFEQALSTRTYEPDEPNYTPRISGIVDLRNRKAAYQLSILKSNLGDPEQTQRHFFNYEQPAVGYGHLIHTYEGDGNPLPSFVGEPRLVPLQDDINANVTTYWDLLDRDNRVALLVKTIRIANGDTELRIVNRED